MIKPPNKPGIAIYFSTKTTKKHTYETRFSPHPTRFCWTHKPKGEIEVEQLCWKNRVPSGAPSTSQKKESAHGPAKTRGGLFVEGCEMQKIAPGNETMVEAITFVGSYRGVSSHRDFLEGAGFCPSTVGNTAGCQAADMEFLRTILRFASIINGTNSKTRKQRPAQVHMHGAVA